MLTIISVYIPIVFFMIIGLSKRSSNLNTSLGFYKGGREALTKEYRDTTVAFSLQVAVTVYFIYWGFHYGWGNLFYIFSWYIGLFIFYKFAKYLLPAIKSFDTMFQFISSKSGKSVQKLLSILTILSLLGLVYVEIFMTSDFVSKTIKSDLNISDSSMWFWISLVVITFSSISYTSLGGFKRVVATDTVQLSFAYIASSILFISLFPYLIKNSIFTLLVIAIPTILIYWLIGYNGKKNKGSSTYAFLSSYLLFFSLVLIIILNFSSLKLNLTNILPKGLFSQINEPWGWVPLIGFCISNIIWQFSDYTAYHRLSGLHLPENKDQQLKFIEGCLKSTLITSPLTWGIGIVLGMAIYSCNIIDPNSLNVFNDFIDFLIKKSHSGMFFSKLGLISLGIFITSVLLSTTDSTFLATSEVFESDLINKKLNFSRRIILLFVLALIVLCFSIIHLVFKYDVLIFLNGIYSLSLIIAPVMFLALLKERINPISIYISIILGVLIGFYFVISPPNINYSILLVLPTLSALLVSTSTLFIFGKILK